MLAKFFGASKTEDNHRKKVGREKCQIDFFGRGVQGTLWYAKILGSRNPYTSLSIKYHPNFTFPGSVRWIFHIFQGTNPWDPPGKLEHHLEKCLGMGHGLVPRRDCMQDGVFLVVQMARAKGVGVLGALGSWATSMITI